jgi:hypothetical protein
LEWIPLAYLKDLPMWTVIMSGPPMVFDDDPRLFHGVMPWRIGSSRRRVERDDYERIGFDRHIRKFGAIETCGIGSLG